MSDTFPCAVVTISDRLSRGEGEDTAGPLAKRLVEAVPGLEVAESLVLPDDVELIETRLTELTDRRALVVTTGGTGLGPRDVTPEATARVIERRVPGMEEAMRSTGLGKTPLAMLSRGLAGSRGSCLILNLPGSPSGVRDGLDAVLPAVPHALRLLAAAVRDCAPEREPHEG